MTDVSKTRTTIANKEPYYRHCLNVVAFACFAPIRILDWLRISRFGRFLVRKGLVRDRSWCNCYDEDTLSESSYCRRVARRKAATDSRLLREARANAKLQDANITWTMSMAFYVLSGGCLYNSNTGE